MNILIHGIGDSGFFADFLGGSSYIGYDGEPDSDSIGTLEFYVVDLIDVTGEYEDELLKAVREEAPILIYEYLVSEKNKEAEMWREDAYV